MMNIFCCSRRAVGRYGCKAGLIIAAVAARVHLIQLRRGHLRGTLLALPSLGHRSLR